MKKIIILLLSFSLILLAGFLTACNDKKNESSSQKSSVSSYVPESTISGPIKVDPTSKDIHGFDTESEYYESLRSEILETLSELKED
ncbi:MAG: hypothetical protein RRY76_02920 [Clostridia bacterium]